MNNLNNIIYHKELNLDKISIKNPVKIDGIYQASLDFNNNTNWSIQIPEVSVNENNLSFSMVKRGQFFTLLEELQEKIIMLIYLNSKTLFNGKTFTEKKIRSSLIKPFEITNEGLVTLKNVTVCNKDLKVYDKFDDKSELPEFPFNATCILKINPIKFVKNDIILSYTITHIKLPLLKKKPQNCILDDEIIPEIIQENIPEIEEEDSNSLDLETFEKNFDNTDFFE